MRLVGATVNTIATKDDIKSEFAELRHDIRKASTDIIWWMFFLAIANVAATFSIFYLFLRK
jgi:hypothetical protein